MRQRALGGLEVSAVGLGCLGLTPGPYGAPSAGTAVALVQAALDAGVSLLDTAEGYGRGANEALLGRALRGRREAAVVATKFGKYVDSAGRRIVDGRPEHVREAIDRSLRHLGLEHVDLYLQHRADPKTPIEETIGAMAALVAAGKVREIGLSEPSPELIRRAHAVHPLAAVESEYSLWTRDPEDGVLATCRGLGIGFIASSPLGRGLLAGRFGSPAEIGEADFRHTNPRFVGAAFDHNLALAGRLRELADRRGITLAQLALGWLLARGEDVVPIPGTTDRARLAENVAAASVALGTGDVEAIEAVSPRGAVRGDRHLDMKSVEPGREGA